jgi:hypothetical protein
MFLPNNSGNYSNQIKTILRTSNKKITRKTIVGSLMSVSKKDCVVEGMVLNGCLS